MGKLIKFPTHRVVYNNEPIRPELSEEEARQIKEDKKDTEERQQELDIQFDPDIKLD